MSPSTLLLLLSYGKLLFSLLLCCSYCSYFCTLLFTCCCTEYKYFAFAFISQSIFIVGWIVVHATKVFDSIWHTHSSGTHRLIHINYKKVFVVVSYFLMIYRKISAVTPWVLRAIVKILISDRLWRTEPQQWQTYCVSKMIRNISSTILGSLRQVRLRSFHILAQPVLDIEACSVWFVCLTPDQMCWFLPQQWAVSHTAWCTKGREAGRGG